MGKKLAMLTVGKLPQTENDHGITQPGDFDLTSKGKAKIAVKPEVTDDGEIILRLPTGIVDVLKSGTYVPSQKVMTPVYITCESVLFPHPQISWEQA